MFKSKLASPLALPVYKAKTQTVAVIVLKQNANHILELDKWFGFSSFPAKYSGNYIVWRLPVKLVCMKLVIGDRQNVKKLIGHGQTHQV